MIVATCFTLYSEDCEKPPIADRALRPVEQCDASPRKIGSSSAAAAPASQRRAIRNHRNPKPLKAPDETHGRSPLSLSGIRSDATGFLAQYRAAGRFSR